MADWLPEGWEVVTKVAKDGSQHELYTNKVTGQVFDTKEAMKRYANYLKNVKPRCEGHSEFKKSYMDEKRLEYVKRPWENDKKHSFQDYLEGKVGILKEMKASGSSSAPKDEIEAVDKLEEIPKEKAPEGSSDPKPPRKLTKKKKQQRRKR